ncbi:MAG: YicC family protein [Desulfovibrio sp.]|nr:YicC family protein [Desulfovibrio sp.]
MSRSMTGFGRCLVENDVGVQQWEIKSVNGKYLDIKWRLPAMARYLEPALEKIVRQHASRGRVEISLESQLSSDYALDTKFDLNLVCARMAKLQELANSRGDVFVPDYTALLGMRDFWGEQTADENRELATILTNGLRIALEDWNESRQIEGDKLDRDLRSRFLLLEEWTETLKSRAPEIREERVATLMERLADALDKRQNVFDEDRFLQEVVLLTDKLDVSEELTRLSAHIERLRELLDNGGENGRKLDFTLQECFREINTCGVKTSDARLSRLVVDFKNELEKCREQVQNLE